MKINRCLKLLVILSMAISTLSCQKDNGASSSTDPSVDPSKNTLSDDMQQESRRKFESSVGSYELKEGVMLMSEAQKQSLIGVENNNTLLFDSTCSGHKMPSVGDVILCLDATEILPQGFQGKVVKTETRDNGVTAVITKMAEIDEMFSTLTVNSDIDLSKCEMLDSLGKPIPYTEVIIPLDSLSFPSDSSLIYPSASNQTKASSLSITAREYQLAIGYPGIKLSGTLAISGSLNLDFDPFRQYFYLGGDIYGEFKAKYNAEITVGVDYEQTKKYIGTIPLVPLGPEPVFTVNLNAYAYVTAEAKVGISFEWSVGAICKMQIQHNASGWSSSVSPGVKISNPFSEGIDVHGTATVGSGERVVIGINMFQYPIWNNEDNYVDVWVGLDGGFDFRLLDATPISILKEAKYDLKVKAGLYTDIKWNNPLGKEFIQFKNEKSATYVVNQFYLYPEFSSLKYELDGNNSAKLSCTQSRSLMMPVKTWFLVIDEDGNDVTGSCEKKYYWIQSLSDRVLSQTVSKLQKRKYYYAYPVASYFGKFDVQSDDYMKFALQDDVSAKTGTPTEVKCSSAVVSGSYEGIFDGSSYSSYGIEYWCNYYSHTVYGNNIFDSKGFTDEFKLSELHPHTHYWYRAIIEYNGQLIAEGETREFETREHSCLDESHIHAIDLGLSVKWACCNVGATRPEEYGGHYAWGETEEKTRYGWWDSYKFNDPNSDDITKYWSLGKYSDGRTILEPCDDVAHMKWGGKWRMPTLEEFEELKANCRLIQSTLNGVKGIYFISLKNGNSIFLPFAGEGDAYFNDNGTGNYWSSSLDTEYPVWAYYMVLCFQDSYENRWGDVYTTPFYRFLGYSVRPVSE